MAQPTQDPKESPLEQHNMDTPATSRNSPETPDAHGEPASPIPLEESHKETPASSTEDAPKKGRRRHRKKSSAKEELSKRKQRKKDFVRLKWGGHAETTPYSLPVTTELLRNNPLDTEITKDILGQIGKRFQKKKKSTISTTPACGPAAPTNWGKLQNLLEERKLAAKPVSNEHITRSWFEMPYAPLTDEQKRDVRVVENRQHLDPKRFYKSAGTGLKKGEFPDQVQFGVIIGAPHDFYSSRLTKRERRRTITEEVMADDKVRAFTKRRNLAIQKHATRKRRVIDPAAKNRKRR